MRAHISNRDYEQLSAYIDGQLAPAEKRKLEERLRVQVELQTALDEINRTRTLLRNAPRRRAPHNFTLTRAMVEEQAAQHRGSWLNLFPVLSFTSALAALALVASIVFQLLPGRTASPTAVGQTQDNRIAAIVQQTMTAMQETTPGEQILAAPQAQKAVPEGERSAQPTQPSQEQPSMSIAAAPTATPEQPAMADNTQATPPIITWNGNTGPQGATGLGGGGGGGGGQGPSLGPLLGPPEAASPNSAYGKGGGGDITSGGSGTIVIPAQGVNSPESAAQPTSTEPALGQEVLPGSEAAPESSATQAPAMAAPAAPEISGTGPILGVPPQDEGGKIVERKAILGQPETGTGNNNAAVQPGQEPNQGLNETSPVGVRSAPPLPLMIAIQALLALVAVATGVAAYLIRRRAK